MFIKLVSCSCVDNMQYYDAVVCFNSVEFSVTSVYYNMALHKWSVKVANKPLFETYLFSDMMAYLSDVVRDLFYR